MKKILHVILLIMAFSVPGSGQITSPVIRANFGVDADLRSNYFDGALQAGNDDWFHFPGTPGTGQFVIDTTGAAAISARYLTDIPFRRTTFARSMRYPAYSIVNNRTLLDAIFVRDFHGDDSTVFASGSNKNGDNPLNWTTPVSQGIPDKNDILDMLVHARRAGPNGSDSLWLMAGLSLDNTTGNRYFDLEMYQTDFYYNRSGLTFGGVGPDAGHTSWEFDASGNIIKAGDIIFSAEYQSSSLTFIEARIWVHQSKLAITPAAFSWSGPFDGASAGAVYGYASIQPKTAGAYYTGLQCGNNTWGGPFSIVLQNDVLATDYDARQYVEFSVNLTKLGLDPLTRLGGDPCGMPFRRVLAKTRASASFTAELKDFVAPFTFFEPPAADIATTTPFLCAEGSVAEIHINNPLSTSSYEWTTTNGNIVGTTTGTSIIVDTPGTYIVIQHLLAGCGAYATDTIQIQPFAPCSVLAASIFDLNGTSSGNLVQLKWRVLNNQLAGNFEIQRSTDGINFIAVGTIRNQSGQVTSSYSFEDDISNLSSSKVYYRIQLTGTDKLVKFSNTINLPVTAVKNKIVILPNPVKDIMQIQVSTTRTAKLRIDLFDATGKLISSIATQAQKGHNVISLDDLAGKPEGVYLAMVYLGDELFRQKIVRVK
jgi:hypothetical protein